MPVTFNELYPKQKEAVKHIGSPLLVLAGPGTGKTEVLAHRIVNLIKQEISPKKILAATFTTKAAKEMRDRLQDFEGIDITGLRVSTLHSEALRILRKNWKETGPAPKFFIADSDEVMMLTKDATEDLGLCMNAKQRRKVRHAIELLKANNIAPSDISDTASKTLKPLYEKLSRFNFIPHPRFRFIPHFFHLKILNSSGSL